MKQNLRRWLLIACAAIFLASGIYLVQDVLTNRAAQESYDEAAAIADVPDLTVPVAELPEPEEIPEAEPDAEDPIETPPAEPRDDYYDDLQPQEQLPEPRVIDPIPTEIRTALEQIDLAALREVNPDVIGWITIPGTPLSYPLMQGEDNAFYLKHTWEKAWATLGSIYMDYRNDAAFGDFNTLIYGHRIDQESMFSSLKHYDSQEHYEANPCIYIVTDAGIACYDIFAAGTTDAKRGHTYRLGLDTDEGQQAYIDYCMALSVLETDVTVAPGDHILTLSTCTAAGGKSDYRWIVQGVLREN